MIKKTMIIILVSIGVMTLLLPAIQASRNGITGLIQQSEYNVSTDSNFFGEKENQTPVDLPDDYQSELLMKGYDLVGETDLLEFYVKERYFNLAIYDKISGYLWYSVYPEYATLGLSGTSKYFVESGVVIEYFNMDNILVDSSKSYLSGSKYNVSIEYDYDSVDQGVKAHLNFNDLAIEFDVLVWVEEGKLIVRLPIDSLVEGQIEKTVLNIDGTTSIEVTENRLKAVYLFPYLGSNNYEINGYSMIPDGSGALIRYTNIRSSTAYTKRIYGSDEGLLAYNSNPNNYYLQDELTASIPVFGVNHGYHQAAFLAELVEGDGCAEIHSYPYGYNSYFFNTTFFKFIVRERYTIQTSSNSTDSFQLVNSSPYPTDFEVAYHFLSNNHASYSGMAMKYHDILSLESSEVLASEVNLTMIGLDYKNGLFGKDFVKMTSYQDVIDIIADLKGLGIDTPSILYTSWTKNGFYDNTPVKPVVSRLLGGTSDFNQMMEYLETNQLEISFYNDPMISFSNALGENVVKKITLSTFETGTVRSSLFASSFFRDPEQISESILKYDNQYDKLGIDSITLGTVGSSLFSYRVNSQNIYRNDAQDIIESEISELNDFNLGISKPNAYLWEYIDQYYDAPIESNKYAYITDSIPFVELVLSGSVTFYSPYINYVSDYDLFSMRLVEYGIRPSFLLTKESTYEFRYTNYAYVYTSEYDLWRSVIVDMTEKVDFALKEVLGARMLSHRYVEDGLAEVLYDNGIIFYINYSNQDIELSSGEIIDKDSVKVVTLDD